MGSEMIEINLESVRFPQRVRNRGAARKADHRFVDRKPGIGIKHFIAFFDHCQDGIEHDGLSPGRNHDLIGRKSQICVGALRSRRSGCADPVIPETSCTWSGPKRESTPALIAESGEEKSGSPNSRCTMCFPWRSSACARARTSKAVSVPSRLILPASLIVSPRRGLYNEPHDKPECSVRMELPRQHQALVSKRPDQSAFSGLGKPAQAVQDLPFTSSDSLAQDDRPYRTAGALGHRSGPAPDTSSDAPVSIEDLASVLYYSAGLTRRRTYSGGEIQFRAAACTGALYSVEL